MPTVRMLPFSWLLAFLSLPALGGVSVRFQSQTPREARIAALEADNVRLTHAVAHLQARADTLASLEEYLLVDTENHTITITGANLRLLSGSGATDDGGDLRGLGNLIVGYNTVPAHRPTGSHNIVVGEGNAWTSYGGMVIGQHNILAAPHAVVSGSHNIATGSYARVSGSGNVVSGGYAVVSGGIGNTASGDFATISGAFRSLAVDSHASVFGGSDTSARGSFSVVYTEGAQ